ncbi:putative low-affinity inorganic phosphate transporter [Carboxydothermus islandicus]|uniref:Phosphate transporter n=1 Tax=Carboxydothermus islandicus TaxID=661089 RepID=A0A1L8D2L8_9THEO|nr:inorganic phosphate transporter [Carboxydothermus islandicus]GAV25428.1 putative low-affinity inorganic phosphate transporter [Carboxydothermus islandicus]
MSSADPIITTSQKHSAIPFSWLITGVMMILVALAFHFILHGGWLASIGVALMAWLAFENGGNDISKSVSTLISGGVTNYRTAIMSGTIATLIGGLTSAWASRQMVKLFSSGLLDETNFPSSIALATLIGAILWVAIATRISMPVSTTHAITGAIIGAGVLSLGVEHIKWGALYSKVVIPLLASPVISITIAYTLWNIIMKLPEGRYLRSVHFLSSMFATFARAVNDTPKIVALGFFITVTTGLDASTITPLFFITAIAMALGSYVKGLPVTHLLAEKITKMDDREALGANLTTALLVSTASKLGLPVSTTHVISSAIIGFGLKKGSGEVSWRVVRDMVLSWVVTLPVAGIFAAILFLIFRG